MTVKQDIEFGHVYIHFLKKIIPSNNYALLYLKIGSL